MRTVLCLLLFAFPAFASGKVDTQMIAPYVEVRTDSGTGSGVLIDLNGSQVVLTAKHVVDNAKEFTLVKKTDCDCCETKWRADVLAIDPGNDIALLKPRLPTGLPSAKLIGGVVLERGEDCWYVGTHSRIHASFEKAIINRPCYEGESAYGGLHKFTLFNGNGWYGNSGGPLFVKRDDDYVVVGVVVQLAALNPRTPLCAERLEAIMEFLGKQQKPAEPPKPSEDGATVDDKDDYEAELIEKTKALVRVKFGGDYRKAFNYYAGKDDLISRSELIDFLKDADVGTWVTRGIWADEILNRIDKDKSGQLSWDEMLALRERYGKGGRR